MINRVTRIGADRSRSRCSASYWAAWSRSRARPVPGSGSASAFRFSLARRPTIIRHPPTTTRRRPIIRRRPTTARHRATIWLCRRRRISAARRAVRPVLRDRWRGLPDGASGRVRLVLLLHHGAGSRLGPRDLMASPPGSGPPEQAQDNPRDPPPAATPQYAAPIEDYAMIGDCHSAALVSREGSIDWLCWPRFDSPACFAALVGTPDNGRWRIAPAEPPVRIRRQYRPGTMILETIFETKDGSVALIDFMTAATGSSSVVRIVEGRGGQVAMRLDLALRFDYGSAVPWVTQLQRNTGLRAIAGPDVVVLHSGAQLHGEKLTTVGEFTVAAGQRVPFTLSHGQSHLDDPVAPDALTALDEIDAGWTSWSSRCLYQGEWRDAGGALAADAEGAHLLSDRRHRRRADHLAARTARRRAQLGLSLLLAARCHVHAARADACRLSRGGAGLGRLAAAQRRRHAGADPDAVRPGGRALADGMGGAVARAAMAARGRCASATPRARSCSSTSTAN